MHLAVAVSDGCRFPILLKVWMRILTLDEHLRCVITVSTLLDGHIGFGLRFGTN